MRTPYEHDEGDLGCHLNEDECMLVTEALHMILQKKREAFAVCDREMSSRMHRPFTERDFGIPQIEALIKKLEGEE